MKRVEQMQLFPVPLQSFLFPGSAHSSYILPLCNNTVLPLSLSALFPPLCLRFFRAMNAGKNREREEGRGIAICYSRSALFPSVSISFCSAFCSAFFLWSLPLLILLLLLNSSFCQRECTCIPYIHFLSLTKRAYLPAYPSPPGILPCQWQVAIPSGH